MKKVVIFSALLVAGLTGSQILPTILGTQYKPLSHVISLLTMVGLSFIMIHVGYEFEIDKSRPRSYGWDYIVAMTAAAFPWIFVTLYFVFVMLPEEVWYSWDTWKETLLAGRFAAPTSAGVLFSMLAAAGLSATWLFRKARILAIFDDLDTVLLMIPLKILIVGLAWQLFGIVAVMVVLLWVAWKYLHLVRIPIRWPWVLGYSVVIVLISELIYAGSLAVNQEVPVHLEVLLPAFVLGCLIQRPEGTDPHRDDVREGHQEGLEHPAEQRIAALVSGAFMLLVGLNMPVIFGIAEQGSAPGSTGVAGITAAQAALGWDLILLHVVIITTISNIGKMFPLFCYRREASVRERLALAIGMWPRGEVGAGVLIISLGYGIGGPVITVAMLSLALNLVLTGVFIVFVKRLLRPMPAASVG